MYPTELGAIDWDMIDFRDNINNINIMYFQPGPIPPRLSTFNKTDTKTPKGPSNNEHSERPSRKKARKIKGSKVQSESTLREWKLRDTKDLIILS